MKSIRIAAGQGFWGDWLEAPVHQVRRGPIDFLMMDYLAEVTMSIMMKQRLKNPEAGYARDFVDLMREILPDIVKKNIRVLANAGGVNPHGCAKAVKAVADKLGLGTKVKIAVVHGDNIIDRIPELLKSGHHLNNLDTGGSAEQVAAKIQSANVYFGARPMVEALDQGANIIITGRVTDTGLTLAPMIHSFGWSFDDWDKMSAGTIAGHIIECGAQCSGGNCSVNWSEIPRLDDVGFPIVEAHADGSFFITKHEGTGGRITVQTVKEQLVYEMGDPKSYITPDCVADFTSIQLEDAGKDRVRVHSIKGRPATELYKVSMSYLDGYKAVGTLVYTWPEAEQKARAAFGMLKRRLDALGLKFDEVLCELVGVDACWAEMTGGEGQDIPEVTLRVGVRSHDERAVERFTKELAPLILNGPPSVTGFAGGRPAVQQIVAYWPALIAKSVVSPIMEFVG